MSQVTFLDKVQTKPYDATLINAQDMNELKAATNTKVDKVTGKQLSTEDYSTAEKTKLSGVATGATANQTDIYLLSRANHTGSQAASTITEDTTHRFATDAEKTSWNAKQAALVSGTNIKTVNGQSLLGSGDIVISGGGTLDTIPTNGSSNGVESNGVFDALSSKQDTLVSGANIKTINGQAIVGTGDITISGTSSWGAVTGTLSNQTDLQNALNLKANLAGPTFTGSVNAPTPAAADSSTLVPTTAWVQTEFTNKAIYWDNTNYFAGAGSSGDPIILKDLGVSTAKIADNAVTLAKFQDIATASFLGRTTAATGDPEVLTATQATALLNVFSSTLKGLVPSSGGGTTNFLRADGTWAAPAGGGGSGDRIKLQASTAFSITSGTFLIINLSTYSSYNRISIRFLTASNTASTDHLHMQFSSDGGATYDAAAGNYKGRYFRSDNSGADAGGGGGAYIELCNFNSNIAGENIQGDVLIFQPQNNSIKTAIRWEFAQALDAGGQLAITGSARRDAVQDTTHVRFFTNGGTIAGNYEIWGE